jgi:tRNA threonylcarbamoyl adenosine modification protein YeaZ
MNLLGIDASSENISFALMKDKDVIFDFNRKMKFGASRVISYIEKYIRKGILNLKEIDAFIVGAGPGSFTGLRISFSIIKAFSISLNIPIISIGSFFSSAYPFKEKYKKIAVISDARRNLIYGTSFLVKDGILYQEKKERLVTIEGFAREKRDYFFVTSDIYLREKVLKIDRKIKFYPRVIYPKAKYLLLLAKDSYYKKKFTPLEKFEPLYIYPKTCQIVAKSKKD